MSRIFLAIYILATSLALVLLKLGTKNGAPLQIVEGKPQLEITALSIMGILLYGFSFMLYMYLISKYDLGYIIPLTTALVYVLIFTASYFIFHETFTALKVAGIVLIVAGLALLNFRT